MSSDPHAVAQRQELGADSAEVFGLKMKEKYISFLQSGLFRDQYFKPCFLGGLILRYHYLT
jgi:hypothetical protein